MKEFIERHLGEAVYRKIIDPFVSGVYAGDPDKLSMKSAFKKIYTLQGMGFTKGESRLSLFPSLSSDTLVRIFCPFLLNRSPLLLIAHSAHACAHARADEQSFPLLGICKGKDC